MKLLILHHRLAPRHVMYLRNFVDDLVAKGHILYGPNQKNYGEGKRIEDVMSEVGPVDGILAMEPKFMRWLPSLADIKIPKAIILSDYYPRKRAWEETNRRLDMDRYDIIFAQTVYEEKALMINNRAETIYYLPMSVRTGYFRNVSLSRDIDIMASWGLNAHAYPERKKVLNLLCGLPYRNFLGQVFYDDYVEMLNRAKIFVNSNPIYKNIQSRFTEVPACGCMMMSDRADDLNAQGFIDGVNMVVYEGLRDLADKIKYYLSNNEKREWISWSGYQHVMKFHSNETRIKELMVYMEGL